MKANPGTVERVRARSLSELRERYVDQGRQPSAAVLAALADDPRAGVRALHESLVRRGRERRRLDRRARRLAEPERALWSAAIERVGGVDEVGMGPLAGPVVAAAVMLEPGARLVGVDDSKQLTARRRRELLPRIEGAARSIGIAAVHVGYLDRHNVYQAGLEAMRRAVAALVPAPQRLLVDARSVPGVSCRQDVLVRGDSRSLSIASASVVAKVHRDRLMEVYDRMFPGYGFAEHAGYGTEAHLDALQRLGPSPIHRRSFAPVARFEPPRYPAPFYDLLDALADARDRDRLERVALRCERASRVSREHRRELSDAAERLRPMPEAIE